MKRNLVIFALLFVCMAIGAQTVFKNEEVEVSLLKEKTWVFSTWDYTTMYLIEGEDKAVLIDTGTRCADLDKIVGQITGKPLEVIVTHMHPDHAGCIKYFDKVWMHRADTVLVPQHAADYQGEFLYMEEGQVFDLGEVWLQCVPMSPIATFHESCCRMEKLMKEGHIKDIWCGHYPYLKSSLPLAYIQTMIRISHRLMNGDQEGSEPYSNYFIKMPPTARKLAEGRAMIVYDSTNIPEAR